MTWAEANDSGLLTIKLSGEIDLQHSPTLRQLLQGKLCQRPAVVLLDFTEVTYIDSSGLATLVEYYKATRSFSGKLAVAGLTNRVRSIFDLVRLGEIFGVFTTLAEAKTALGRGEPKA